MDKQVIDITKEFKRAQRKAWFKEKIQSTKQWCSDNKEILVIAVPGAIGLVTTAVKAVGKSINTQKEERVKNEYCYDRSLGHYWELRRKLTNQEWVEIDKRKKNGERLADILDSLKVLK